MKSIAIVGFGRAGHSAAETLRKNGYDGHICVFTDYDTGVENPMLTTYYATEKIEEKNVMPFGDFNVLQRELDIEIKARTRVDKLCPESMELIWNENGKEKKRKFDNIIVAAGSEPITPPFDAKDPQKVITIRNIGDARRMKYALYHSKKVLVVGCSMIGIKVVQGLSEHNADITFIDFADKVFPTASLEGTAEILEARIKEKGVKLFLNTGIDALREGEDGKLEAEFTDGRKGMFDTAFLCMGTRARTDVVKESGIEIGRAIVVDDHMRTNMPHIYAAGDCVEAHEISTGNNMNVALWANAAVQGRIAAENILGKDTSYEGNLICNITHFWDTDFVSIGNNRAEGEFIEYRAKSGWYFKAVCEDGKIQCVNIIDNPELSGIFRDCMKKAFSGEKENEELLEYSAGRFGLPRDVLVKIAEATG